MAKGRRPCHCHWTIAGIQGRFRGEDADLLKPFGARDRTAIVVARRNTFDGPVLSHNLIDGPRSKKPGISPVLSQCSADIDHAARS